MTNKQIKALKTIEYFIPDHIDWTSSKIKLSFSYLGLTDIRESKEGVPANQAFFMKTERGKLPSKVDNIARLASLLCGQRYMAMQIKEWKQSLRYYVPLIYIDDFQKEPEYIKELLCREVFI